MTAHLRVVTFAPRPIPGHALPQSKSTVSPLDWRRPERATDRAIQGPDIKGYPRSFRWICLAIGLAMFAYLFSGCGEQQAEAGPISRAQKVCQHATGAGDVFRCHDSEVHATCWVFSGESRGEGGIACLPDSQLKPQAEAR